MYSLNHFFKADDSRPEMIATFLAVLEMIKLNKLYADYDEKSDDFILTTEKRMDNIKYAIEGILLRQVSLLRRQNWLLCLIRALTKSIRRSMN